MTKDFTIWGKIPGKTEYMIELAAEHSLVETVGISVSSRVRAEAIASMISGRNHNAENIWFCVKGESADLPFTEAMCLCPGCGGTYAHEPGCLLNNERDRDATPSADEQ